MRARSDRLPVVSMVVLATFVFASGCGSGSHSASVVSTEDAAERLASVATEGSGDYEPFVSVEEMASASDAVVVGSLVAVRDSLVIPLEVGSTESTAYVAFQIQLTEVVSQDAGYELAPGQELFLEHALRNGQDVADFPVDGIDQVMVFLTDVTEERFPDPLSDPLAAERGGRLWGRWVEGLLLEDSSPGVVSAGPSLAGRGPGWQFASIDEVVARVRDAEPGTTVAG